MNADKILVLDKGEVVAQGKHADLMEDRTDLCRDLQLTAHVRASRRRTRPGGGQPMMGGGGMRHAMLDQETIKPRDVGNTLARLGHYFREFWYALSSPWS